MITVAVYEVELSRAHKIISLASSGRIRLIPSGEKDSPPLHPPINKVSTNSNIPVERSDMAILRGTTPESTEIRTISGEFRQVLTTGVCSPDDKDALDKI